MDDKRVVPKSKGEQVRVSRGGDSSDRVAVVLLWSLGGSTRPYRKCLLETTAYPLRKYFLLHN